MSTFFAGKSISVKSAVNFNGTGIGPGGRTGLVLSVGAGEYAILQFSAEFLGASGPFVIELGIGSNVSLGGDGLIWRGVFNGGAGGRTRTHQEREGSTSLAFGYINQQIYVGPSQDLYYGNDSITPGLLRLNVTGVVFETSP